MNKHQREINKIVDLEFLTLNEEYSRYSIRKSYKKIFKKAKYAIEDIKQYRKMWR